MNRRKRAAGSDFEKVDAYVLGPKDYEEIPELTDEDFARAVLHIGGEPVEPGDPRIKAALRKAAKLPAAKKRKKA